MRDWTNYIVCGDTIIATPRSVSGDPIQGRVIEVIGSEAGRREFLVEVEGTNVASHGAIGLPEARFLFEVERGDAWVSIPPFLLIQEAEAKATRSVANTRRRIQKAVPLFADQIVVGKPDVDRMASRAAEHRRETLEREHELAMRSTELRAQVAAMVNEDQFAVLQAARSRFPRSALYGIYFWQKQLQQLKCTGKPDIYVPPLTLNTRCGTEWLRIDAHVLWTSAQGTKRVRVLYVGTSTVLVKLPGAPIVDYDPREFPNGNRWVEPHHLQPLSV
jgi:hypothetical protein